MCAKEAVNIREQMFCYGREQMFVCLFNRQSVAGGRLKGVPRDAVYHPPVFLLRV